MTPEPEDDVPHWVIATMLALLTLWAVAYVALSVLEAGQ